VPCACKRKPPRNWNVRPTVKRTARCFSIGTEPAIDFRCQKGAVTAMRRSWEGCLQLSLISIPVRAYNAAVSGQGEVRLCSPKPDRTRN
jgi:hypothetical protein